MKQSKLKHNYSMLCLAAGLLGLVACASKAKVAVSQDILPQELSSYEKVDVNKENTIKVSEDISFDRNNYFKPIRMGKHLIDKKIIVDENVDSWQALSQKIYQTNEHAQLLKKINQTLPNKGDWVYASSFQVEENEAMSEQFVADKAELDVEVSNHRIQQESTFRQPSSSHEEIVVSPRLSTPQSGRALTMCDNASGLAVDRIYPNYPISCTYVVQRGDTLSRIARFIFGTAKLWPKIYKDNLQVIGDNPNRIYPKQTLGL